MPALKKTKIVATLGPATRDKKILKRMIIEGVNVFRINFSHANYEEVKKRIKMIRDLGDEIGSSTAILADLQGPKLRVGVMKEEVVVNLGDELDFCTGEEFEGTHEKVYMNYDNFSKDVKPKERILLDDGKLIFEVLKTNGKDTPGLTQHTTGGEPKERGESPHVSASASAGKIFTARYAG